MSLRELGFDQWFHEQLTERDVHESEIARITRVDRGRYLIHDGQKEIQAEMMGKFLHAAESSENIPCIGDWVSVEYHNEGTMAMIRDRLPRKTFLRRKTSGKMIEIQMLAANIDTAFIMQSCDRDFNLRRMERYLVMVKEGNIEPIILLSKSDLVADADLEEMISMIRQNRIESRIMAFSNNTGNGLEAIHQALEKSKTYCLLGSSGVGKTTLLNKFIGKEIFETNPVRTKDSRGRHTTAYRQLIVLDNGALLIDTPGLRELGMIGVNSSIDESFSEIMELAAGCRFNDCSHIHEAGCAIRTAIKNGELEEERYQNYLKLKKESAYHQMSYVEKRHKDKEFGRMVKSIMKHKKKR